jgi:hypothetical protein
MQPVRADHEIKASDSAPPELDLNAFTVILQRGDFVAEDSFGPVFDPLK